MILNILEASTRKRVEKTKEELPLEDLKGIIYAEGTRKNFNNREDFAFERAMKRSGISFICEVKKASPSKGILVNDFPYLSIAKEYEEGGAAAISVLTEPEYFKGKNQYLAEISKEVDIPVLRKDFTVDEYQIYEAKVLGADAVLLICRILDRKTMENYIRICNDLGLSALVEAHTKEEVQMGIEAGARMIGVNNRNLDTFQVDLRNCINLKKLVPEEAVFIAESGIKTGKDIEELKAMGVDGVLIGETLMKSENKKEMLKELKRGIP